jgi:uncharacterized RDD family membrane protein YckC
MNWFYAENGQQKGPVGEYDFTTLINNGAIKASTPVWREGMPDWQPLSMVRPDLLAATNAPSIGGFAVPEHQKDLLVQQMREGVLVEVPQSGATIYVGFWWRVLGALIDWVVVMTASCAFAIPLGMVAGLAAASGGSASGPDTTLQLGAQLMGNFIGLVIQALYATWMVGKYGATLGKMAIGAKVVVAGGGNVSYGRALGRWAVKSFVNGTILGLVMFIPVVVVLFVSFGGLGALESFQKGNGAAVMGMVFALMASGVIGGLVGAFPWWMCGFDPEKRGLHDRICSTRVVRK